MGWQPGMYSLLAFASAGVAAGVIFLAWRHRFEQSARAFFGVVLVFGSWALVYGIQLGFQTTFEQLGLQRVVLILAALVPPLWLVFALQYTKRGDWITRPVVALFAVEPVAFAALTLTNPSHGLVIQRVVLTPVADSYALAISFGPGYFAHIAYSYLLVGAGFVLLILEYRESEFYRTQIGLLVLGPLPPLLAHVTHTFGIDWGSFPTVDPTPIVFVFTGVFFAVVQFDLLDRVQVARTHALAETADGFVVLDSDETIISLNPAAREVLEVPTVGKSFWESYPETIEDARDLESIHGTTVTTTAGGLHRTSDVSCSSLTDRHGRDIGWVVSFRDVTDRHAYEQRLEIAHRVLRHDLRNRMNVIHGWADHIATAGPDEYSQHAHRITETAEGLIELSEKTQTMVASATVAKGDPEPVSVRDRIDPLLERFRREHPTVTVETDVPPGATVVVPDAELIDVALQNLLENSVEHNDAEEPSVSVTLERPDDSAYIQIHVADNGPGIREMERTVLREGSETPLQHGSGLGLWLVYWSVRGAGGELSFETNESRGSIVSFTLPATTGASAH